MYYGITVRLDTRRDARYPAFRREIDAALKAQRNLAYRQFRTVRAAEIELAKLPAKVRAECVIETYDAWAISY